MITYISCGIVRVKTAIGGVSKNLWFQVKIDRGGRGGSVLHRFSDFSCEIVLTLRSHCILIKFQIVQESYNVSKLLTIKMLRNTHHSYVTSIMKHLYTKNLAGPKFYFAFAGFTVFSLFSSLYEKYWVIQTSNYLVCF